MPTSFTPPVLTHAAAWLARYDVLLCDVWGVVHDGVRAIPSACEALTRFRAGGGTVVLVSNAPLPPVTIAGLLDDKQVPRSAWDRIVSSGGLAARHVAAQGWRRVHKIGPPGRDDPFFDLLPPHAPITEAEAIVCSGLVDDRTERAEQYREQLIEPAGRRVPFVCANPDLHVHVGADLLPCAGAIATIYEALGGPVVWAGKPHPIAYATARAEAEDLRGGPVPAARMLGIGDTVRTDLASASGAGVDSLFIARGIHRDDVLRAGRIDPEALSATLAREGHGATAAMLDLAW
jgi:HAD superfamily hydrolase (TIGR01450 family)